MASSSYDRIVRAVGWRLPGPWPGAEVHVFRRPAPPPGAGFRRVPDGAIASLLEGWLHSIRARDALLELLPDHVHPQLIGPRACLWFRDDVRSALEQAFRRGDLVAYAAHAAHGTAGAAGGAGARPAPAAAEPPAPAAPARPAYTFVAIRLLWERGEPIPRRRFRVELPDGMAREGTLDPAGFARIDGIEPGACGVVFPDLDRGDWRAQGGAFAAPWVVGGAAKRQHVVQQGEHLSRIASRYGFQRAPTIWHHPDNAALSGQRKSPHVLAPGDRLVIPPPQPGIVWVPASQEHRFVVPELPLALRLAALDHDLWPVASADAVLEADGSATPQPTDPRGRVERPISVTAEPGRLVLAGRDLRLRVGHLDPVDTPAGLRARLDHLGYEPGPAEGGTDEELRSAVEEFQCDLGLTVDGISGPETQAKLVQVHGC